MGHYFSLRHPYERGCLEDPTKGDFVADTPPAVESWFRQCPPIADSCPTLPGNDPVMNYMYATTDACRRSWTPGQIDRMLQKVTEFRPDIGGMNVILPRGLSMAPNSEWYFYEGTYHVPPGEPLAVQGRLSAQNVVFTASESSWKGIMLTEGSEGILKNVTLTQVSDNAGIAALTVRECTCYPGQCTHRSLVRIYNRGDSCIGSIQHNVPLSIVPHPETQMKQRSKHRMKAAFISARIYPCRV